MRAAWVPFILLVVLLSGCATAPNALQGASLQTVKAEGADGTTLAMRFVPDPALTAPSAVLVFVHGFLRGAARHHNVAARLARDGVVVLLPELDSPLGADARARDIRQMQSLLAGEPAIAAGLPLFIGGFSRGGGIALAVAADASRPLAGLVLVDPVTPVALPPDLASRLPPVALITAPPAACNAQGRSFDTIRSQLKPLRDVRIPDATHCDAEGPSDALCAMHCGLPDVARQAAFEDALVDFVLGQIRR